MSSQLEETLASLHEALQSSYSSIRHGDKQVTVRSSEEVISIIRVARALDEGPAKAVVCSPRRPRL